MKNIYLKLKNFYKRKKLKGILLAISRRIQLYFWQRPYWTIMHYIHSRFRAKKIPSFVFQGKKCDYVYGIKNLTWRNERIIEVPIVWSYIKNADSNKVLEVGNVLHNYYPIKHDVVDKYEKGENIINEDAATFSAHTKYDWIVSISTLEHAGWDWPEEKDSNKIPVAIENLKKQLSSGGEMIITMPLGYNAFLDKLIDNNELGLEAHFMKRISAENEWIEVSYEDVRGSRYNHPFPSANVIFIGTYKKD